jgi:hypothetical protein
VYFVSVHTRTGYSVYVRSDAFLAFVIRQCQERVAVVHRAARTDNEIMIHNRVSYSILRPHRYQKSYYMVVLGKDSTYMMLRAHPVPMHLERGRAAPASPKARSPRAAAIRKP